MATASGVEGQLGEGGMGVVYRALDTKLNRPVAIKFLSNELADTEARHRFQREAQMASSLNHPHILTVHDVGDFESRQYLVTKFREEVGLPPKTVARILRFQRALALADGAARPDWAGIAADCGYADQAHLVHPIPG